MLITVPNDDNVIVKNKGVEVAIICDGGTLDSALEACKVLSVSGTSCAVLEIGNGDIASSQVITFYEEIVSAFVFLSEKLKDRTMPLLKETTTISVACWQIPKDIVTSITDIINKNDKQYLRNDVNYMQEVKDKMPK